MIKKSPKLLDRRALVLLAAVGIWCFLFPEDLQMFSQAFEVTKSISNGAYVLISTVFVCWTWRIVSRTS